MRMLRVLCALAFLGLTQQSLSAVAIVGSPTLVAGGGTVTAGAGSSRILACAVAEKVASGTTTLAISTLAIGTSTIANGKILTAATLANTANFTRGIAAVYYIKEANIQSGAQTISATWNQAVAGTDLFTCYTLSGVNQTTPIDTTATRASSAGENPATGTIAVASNTLQILSAYTSTANSSTPNAGWTEDRDTADSAALEVTAQDAVTSSGATLTWKLTFAGNNNTDVAIASFAPTTAPTFSVSPAVGTRTTSSVPITATTACTDCTMTGIEQTAGAAAPTVAQIKAGQDHTGSAAFSTCSVSPTANVQATCTFSSITDGTVKDAYFALNSTAGGDIASAASIANVYKLPAFTSGPTFSSCGTGGCTYSFTLDGAGTVYGVACKAGSTAATVTQTEAAHCTGDVAAEASANKAVTGADTLVIGTSLTLPEYDFALVGTYGSQHEAATHADTSRVLSPPATCGGNGTTQCQYVTIASIGTGSPCASFNSATSPAIASPDILKAPATTHPGGFSLTIGTDCQFSYPGDGSRQDALGIGIYDYSALAFHADTMAFWGNNQPPIPPLPPDSVTYFIPLNVPMTPVNLSQSGLCISPEGDHITYSFVSTPPTGITIDEVSGDSTLHGTATVRALNKGLTWRCTDITGDHTDWH
jgi:hypothetical protein